LPGDVADETAQRGEKKFLFVHGLGAPSERRGFFSLNKTAPTDVTNRSTIFGAGSRGLLARLLFVQVGANRQGVIGVDGAVVKFNVLDNAVFIYDDIGAPRPIVGFALFVVSLEDAVVLEHFLVHVAEERKLDVDLLGESGVCCGGIHTYTENSRIVRIDLTGSESSLDRLKLLRSTTGEGEDVNGEEDILFAAEVRQLDGLPLVAEESKVRSVIANFQRSCGDLLFVLGTNGFDYGYRDSSQKQSGSKGTSREQWASLIEPHHHIACARQVKALKEACGIGAHNCRMPTWPPGNPGHRLVASQQGKVWPGFSGITLRERLRFSSGYTWTLRKA
jgi:hypothetical protein